MNIEPRKRFLADENSRRRHADLFGSSEMQDWITTAYAEYCFNLPGSRGAVEAMDANSRREGAREFISVLMNLSNQLKPTVRVDDNLPHKP